MVPTRSSNICKWRAPLHQVVHTMSHDVSHDFVVTHGSILCAVVGIQYCVSILDIGLYLAISISRYSSYCELHNDRPFFTFPYCFQGQFCKLPCSE